jgi:hypothetical protein
VIFRRRCQRVKLPDITEFIADIFKPTDAGHQLAAAYCRISDRAVVFFNQADAVAVFVFELQPLEIRVCGASARASLSRNFYSRRRVFLADVADCNLQMLPP